MRGAAVLALSWRGLTAGYGFVEETPLAAGLLVGHQVAAIEGMVEAVRVRDLHGGRLAGRLPG